MKDLPGNEAFEAAQDVGFREPFTNPSGRVGLGLFVPAQPDHGDAVQGGIGLAVTATVQAVPVGLARAGRQGADCTATIR